ncbi:hypothetical protein [Candidatus Vidania fulgoroideorum]
MNINKLIKKCYKYKYLIISNLYKINNNFLNKLKILSKKVFIKVIKINLFKKLYNVDKGNLFFFFNDIENFHRIYCKFFNKKIYINNILSFRKKIKINFKSLFFYKKKEDIFLELINYLNLFLKNFNYFILKLYECKRNI